MRLRASEFGLDRCVAAAFTALLGACGGGSEDDAQPALATAAKAVAFQIDTAHSGLAANISPTFPASPSWTRTLPGAVSYPLIADGKVFVLTAGSSSGGYGTQLVALDETTGATVWGPIDIGGLYQWSGHAYDHGTIFVVNFDGILRSFDAATGRAGWSVNLPGQYIFSSPPTASDGKVYVGGAGSGGTVYAVEQASGALSWSVPVVNGDHSSPVVGPNGIFVSYPCRTYALGLATGVSLWRVDTGCSGGGGKTAAYAAGNLYVRDFGLTQPKWATYVRDASTGALLTSRTADGFVPATIVAAAGGAAYQTDAGTLRRWNPTLETAAWSFAGDGTLVSAPIVIGSFVVVGGSSGRVYALDATTGSVRWTALAAASIAAPDEQNVSQPLTGLAAGEGYLIVPAGDTLTAWRLVTP